MLHALIFAVAFLYGSVGHGGASGYLAALSLMGFVPADFKASALILNLLVAALSFFNFWKEGYFDWELFWPFAVLSIPAAFAGGLISIPARVYGILLAVTLAFAATRLALPDAKDAGARPVSKPAALLTGGALGVLSGMVGVGGGIFLSPLMILMGWADAKKTAAISAAFIWVNSAAGLFGSIKQAGIGPLALWPLALAAGAGGLLGSRVGARYIGVLALRRVLAVVLAIAAYKLFIVGLRA